MNARNIAALVAAYILALAITALIWAKPPGPCQCWRLEGGDYFCCGEAIGGCGRWPTPPAPCSLD